MDKHPTSAWMHRADLKTVCDNFGLQQMVREPTRNQYLLDLYLTDVPGTKMTVGPSIADHCFLLASVPLPEITTLHMTRQRFNIARADWSSLKAALVSVDCSSLQRGCADDGATFFMELLWTALCTHIPYEDVVIKKSSHPWLNLRCENVIKAKNAAEGTLSSVFSDLDRRISKAIDCLESENRQSEKRKQTMVAFQQGASRKENQVFFDTAASRRNRLGQHFYGKG